MKQKLLRYSYKSAMTIAQIISGFVSMLVLYIIIVWFGMMVPTSFQVHGEKDIKVFVRSNGVHTDVCMPVKNDLYDWRSYIDTSDYPSNSTNEYIGIGWGDKGFFLDTPTWADLSAKTALTAMFLPSPCAMHVEYMTEPQDSDMCALEMITKDQYAQLIEYIQSSFLTTDDEVIYIPGTSYWGTDHFYEASGDYHMFNTCNSWTNGALKSAHINTALYAMFPNTIMHYRK
jgi:uncharacterized protein (TIGR02117 family)